jgi:hypothetical protein
MHVEGEGGRGAALGQLLGDEGVAKQAHAIAPQLDGHVEAIEPGLAQGGVVLHGVACLAVVLGRARGEVAGQGARAFLKTALFLGDAKVHG